MEDKCLVELLAFVMYLFCQLEEMGKVQESEERVFLGCVKWRKMMERGTYMFG